MAEAFNDLALTGNKPELYSALLAEMSSVLEGETNHIARMATAASMLARTFPGFFWTGFYLVDKTRVNELVIGPYQGSLGCLRIAFERGVCGAAASRRETILVDDVDSFPGHIACDSQSRSEIVVPVFDRAGDLVAVLDVDATETGFFDSDDKTGLEAIAALIGNS